MLAQTQHQVVFYNVENLFDTITDTTRSHNEFTPTTKKKWDQYKLTRKINELAKCINAASQGGAEFIGLAEVENKKVLQLLCQHPLLFPQHFEIIHFESEDVRGIDVAFLYRSAFFDLLSFKKIKIPLKKRPTRDILLTVGIHATSGDTLSFLVNHWPSRYGGKKKSEKSRVLAAQTLKKQIDSLVLKYPKGKIIAMGDFNDTPKDSSINKTLRHQQLTNLFEKSPPQLGTLKYKRKWYTFDQFIVSNNLLSQVSAAVFTPKWLLEKDNKYGGEKPKRTYIGPRYHGGISDHLPIVLQLNFKPSEKHQPLKDN